MIHLIRNPIEVSLSRSTKTFTALYARGSRLLEAQIYCRILSEDIELFQRINSSIPNQMHRVIYDDLSDNPENIANRIFKQLGLHQSKTVYTWLQAQTAKRKTLPDDWRRTKKRTISPQNKTEIVKTCKRLYQLLPEVNWNT